MNRDLTQLIRDLIGCLSELLQRPGQQSQLALDSMQRDLDELREQLPEIEAALAPPPSAEPARVEPVAYIEFCTRRGCGATSIDPTGGGAACDNGHDWGPERPLYLAPAPTEPASPLSAEEREQAEGWLIELENSAGTNHVGAGRDENFARLLFRLLTLLDQQSAQLATQAKALEAMAGEFHCLNSALAAEDWNAADEHLTRLGNLGLADPRATRTTEGGEG